jgi:hypothetical protein
VSEFSWITRPFARRSLEKLDRGAFAVEKKDGRT